MSDVKLTEEDGPNYRGVWLFGRDVNKIECFRESFINGYAGAAVGSVIGYIYKNQLKVALNAACASYFITTLYSWVSCRYKSYKRRQDWKNIIKIEEDTVEKSGEYNVPNTIKRRVNESDK